MDEKVVPQMSSEKKLAIRDLQVEALSLHSNIRTAQDRIQTINQQISALVDAAAKELELETTSTTFDISTLTFGKK